METEYTTHPFEVHTDNAVIRTESKEICGHLEANGYYAQEWIISDFFSGTDRTPNRKDISSIDGLFRAESDCYLGDPLEVYDLRFPLLQGTASVSIRVEETAEHRVWRITQA